MLKIKIESGEVLKCPQVPITVKPSTTSFSMLQLNTSTPPVLSSDNNLTTHPSEQSRSVISQPQIRPSKDMLHGDNYAFLLSPGYKSIAKSPLPSKRLISLQRERKRCRIEVKLNRPNAVNHRETYLSRKEQFWNKLNGNLSPPEDFAQLISSNAARLEKDELNVCAISIECIEVLMKDSYGAESYRRVACWVSIVDSKGQIILNEFIKHPYNDIKRMPDSGLSSREMRLAPFLKPVKFKVLEKLRRYKRIIVFGQVDVFAHLFITAETHANFLPKLIDINAYYNYLDNGDSFSLEFIVFTMFGLIFHQEFRIPVHRAMYLMYLYLIDYKQIEEVRSFLLNYSSPVKFYKDENQYVEYKGYVYPKNERFRGLVVALKDLIDEWPDEIRIARKQAFKVF